MGTGTAGLGSTMGGGWSEEAGMAGVPCLSSSVPTAPVGPSYRGGNAECDSQYYFPGYKNSSCVAGFESSPPPAVGMETKDTSR